MLDGIKLSFEYTFIDDNGEIPDGIRTTINDNKKSVTLIVEKNNGWGIEIDDNNKKYTLSDFNKPINSYFYSKTGLAITETYLLFLMENGSVEYIYLYDSIQNNNFEVKKINELSNIVELYSAYVKSSGIGSHYTTIAKDKNGKLYELLNYIPT